MTDHALYRFYDADDQLLYIGITANIGARFKQHSDGKPWWVEVHRVTLEHYPNRASVLAAETAAIINEHPRYNVVHNRNRVRPRRRDAVRFTWSGESSLTSVMIERPTGTETMTAEEFANEFMDRHPRIHGPWPELKTRPCWVCQGEFGPGNLARAMNIGGRIRVVHDGCRGKWIAEHTPEPDTTKRFLDERRDAILRGDIL